MIPRYKPQYISGVALNIDSTTLASTYVHEKERRTSQQDNDAAEANFKI